MSSYFSFNKKYKINIVGAFPTGFKTPLIPPFRLYSMVITDAVSIAIVTFITNISMCKLFSKKYNYDVQPNQVSKHINMIKTIIFIFNLKELFTYGITNLFGGFFSGFPSNLIRKNKFKIRLHV